MEKCNECRSTENLVLPKPRRMSTRSQPHPETAVRNTQPSWLNISLDAALGCRASVFSIVKQPGKRGKSQDAASVTIHPQAAPIVFRYAFIFHLWDRSRYSDSLRAGRSGDRFPVGARFSAPVQTGPGAYPASCTVGTRSFLGVKWPGHGIDHPPPSSAEVKERRYSLWAFMACSKADFTFLPLFST